MAVMIKLLLAAPEASIASIGKLPGLKDLKLDERFGVVGINPKDGLYVVRVDTLSDLEERKRLSPEILDAYGDVRISTT